MRRKYAGGHLGPCYAIKENSLNMFCCWICKGLHASTVWCVWGQCSLSWLPIYAFNENRYPCYICLLHKWQWSNSERAKCWLNIQIKHHLKTDLNDVLRKPPLLHLSAAYSQILITRSVEMVPSSPINPLGSVVMLLGLNQTWSVFFCK